jgi:flavodoxin I
VEAAEMKALVVYDTFFGNTEQIARAVGNALGSAQEVSTLPVGEVQGQQLAGLQLLVVGSPTRGFRPTPKITDFLKGLAGDSLGGVKVAAFDTRIAPGDINSSVLRALVKLGGYAAKPIAERLRKRGGELVVPPEGFAVKGTEGPLAEGELERATQWANLVREAVAPR